MSSSRNTIDETDIWLGLKAIPQSQISTSIGESEVIEEFCPLGRQFGADPPKNVPEPLDDLLFDVTSNASLQTDSPEQCYAVLDAARLPDLPDILAASGLSHQCLFQGEAVQEIGDRAPWLVALTEDNSMTRRLFSLSDAPWHLWRHRPGMFLRTKLEFSALRRHLRRFTRLRDTEGKWFHVRFWEPGFLEAGASVEADALFRSLIAPMSLLLWAADHRSLHYLQPTSGMEDPGQPLPQLSTRLLHHLSIMRREQAFLQIAEALWHDNPVLTAGPEAAAMEWAVRPGWRTWRSYAMGWCNEASNRYGLVTVKYVHAYCLFRLHLPWAFETPEHSAQIEAVLAGPGDESKRMKGLADRLKEMTTIREHNA